MQQLTLLSHNVFWFQGAPFATDSPPAPDPEVMERLCAVYRPINADVICLQEVQSQEAFEKIAACLEMPGFYTPGNELPQYGGAVFWRPGRGRIIPHPQESAVAPQRMWQLVEVDGIHRRFKICNIHLPSNRQLEAGRAATQRVAEMSAAIQAAPDVIAGDFNELPGGRVSALLEGQGYVDSATLSECMAAPTNINGNRGDYICIKTRVRDCFLRYGVAARQQLACGNLAKRYLSDHLPLWIVLEAQ